MRLVSGLSGQTACSTPPWVSMQYNVRTTSAAWILHASGQQRQHVSAPAQHVSAQTQHACDHTPIHTSSQTISPLE